MEKIIIREAHLGDLENLLLFEQALTEAERPFDPALKPAPVHYYNITEMIIAPHINLLVAEHNDVIAGCGYARIENSKHYAIHPQHAYLGFMYVVPEQRGKGIIRLIIEALKQWAKSNGITELRLEVLTGNQAAVKAYEKAGFSGYLLQMRMGI
jgi:GNAT superfamily N-acetyltransferase